MTQNYLTLRIPGLRPSEEGPAPLDGEEVCLDQFAQETSRAVLPLRTQVASTRRTWGLQGSKAA